MDTELPTLVLAHSGTRSTGNRSHPAIVAYFDREDREAKQLFPGMGELYLPDFETLLFCGDDHFSVDRYVEFIRSANEV